MIREQFRIMAVLKISLGVATVALSEPIEAIEMKLMADFVLIPMTINVSRSLSPIKSRANSATAVVEVNCCLWQDKRTYNCSAKVHSSASSLG